MQRLVPAVVTTLFSTEPLSCLKCISTLELKTAYCVSNHPESDESVLPHEPERFVSLKVNAPIGKFRGRMFGEDVTYIADDPGVV